MWEEVCGAPISLLSSLRVAVKVGVLTFEGLRGVLPSFSLFVSTAFVHFVLEMFPQHVTLG